MKNYNWVTNAIFIGLIFLALILIISPAYAGRTVNSSIYVINATDSTITWNVSYLSANRPLGATFDAVEIEGFQKEFNTTYTASGLEPLTNHTFCVYGAATINCEEGNTTTSRNPIDRSGEIFYLYIWAILAILLICAAYYFKIYELGMVAFVLAFIGLGLSNDGYGLSTLIHGLILSAAVTVTFVIKE